MKASELRNMSAEQLTAKLKELKAEFNVSIFFKSSFKDFNTTFC